MDEIISILDRQLRSLVYAWGSAYEITCTPRGTWRARWLGSPAEVLTDTTADGLRQQIRHDHYVRTVTSAAR